MGFFKLAFEGFCLYAAVSAPVLFGYAAGQFDAEGKRGVVLAMACGLLVSSATVWWLS